MKKNRTHLTPEEVQEFINLGVDFGETHNYWVIGDNGYVSEESTSLDVIEEAIQVANPHAPNVIYKPIPAPNLHEVLEVLPKYLEFLDVNGAVRGAFYLQRLNAPSVIDLWVAGYRDRIDFMSHNPLIAVANLLRWVCKNHPETLTKTE